MIMMIVVWVGVGLVRTGWHDIVDGDRVMS